MGDSVEIKIVVRVFIRGIAITLMQPNQSKQQLQHIWREACLWDAVSIFAKRQVQKDKKNYNLDAAELHKNMSNLFANYKNL